MDKGRLTCDQVLILVDVEPDATQTVGGAGVDVLHVLDLVKSSVHLWDAGIEDVIASGEADETEPERVCRL